MVSKFQPPPQRLIRLPFFDRSTSRKKEVAEFWFRKKKWTEFLFFLNFQSYLLPIASRPPVLVFIRWTSAKTYRRSQLLFFLFCFVLEFFFLSVDGHTIDRQLFRIILRYYCDLNWELVVFFWWEKKPHEIQTERANWKRAPRIYTDKSPSWVYSVRDGQASGCRGITAPPLSTFTRKFPESKLHFKNS